MRRERKGGREVEERGGVIGEGGTKGQRERERERERGGGGLEREWV
jgi:hypothetical protein